MHLWKKTDINKLMTERIKNLKLYFTELPCDVKPKQV